MFRPVTTSLLLALFFFSTACGNAKFNGTGKKKDRNSSEVTVVDPTPTPTPTPEPCKPGETCVVVDPQCIPGAKDCPVSTDPGNPKPPVDECKDGKTGKDCPNPPPQDCDDNPGQNPGQNSGNGTDKTCPSDDPGQNSAHKGK